MGLTTPVSVTTEKQATMWYHTSILQWILGNRDILINSVVSVCLWLGHSLERMLEATRKRVLCTLTFNTMHFKTGFFTILFVCLGVRCGDMYVGVAVTSWSWSYRQLSHISESALASWLFSPHPLISPAHGFPYSQLFIVFITLLFLLWCFLFF